MGDFIDELVSISFSFYSSWVLFNRSEYLIFSLFFFSDFFLSLLCSSSRMEMNRVYLFCFISSSIVLSVCPLFVRPPSHLANPESFFFISFYDYKADISAKQLSALPTSIKSLSPERIRNNRFPRNLQHSRGIREPPLVSPSSSRPNCPIHPITRMVIETSSTKGL